VPCFVNAPIEAIYNVKGTSAAVWTGMFCVFTIAMKRRGERSGEKERERERKTSIGLDRAQE